MKVIEVGLEVLSIEQCSAPSLTQPWGCAHYCCHITYLGHGAMSVPHWTGLCQCFFCHILGNWVKNQFAFMWEGQQGAFQVLPQDCLHSPTINYGMVNWDLSLFFPTTIKWSHYIDDKMLTCEDLPMLQDIM